MVRQCLLEKEPTLGENENLETSYLNLLLRVFTFDRFEYTFHIIFCIGIFIVNYSTFMLRKSAGGYMHRA